MFELGEWEDMGGGVWSRWWVRDGTRWGEGASAWRTKKDGEWSCACALPVAEGEPTLLHGRTWRTREAAQEDAMVVLRELVSGLGKAVGV